MANYTREELVSKAQSKLKGVNTQVANAVLSAIKECYDRYNIGVVVTQGYRSIAEQNELYAQGRTKPGAIVTNAKGGQSNHNFGVAVDLAIDLVKDGKIDDWTPSAYVVNVMKRRGFKWGGDWKSFVDLPHFEACNWVGGDKVISCDTSVWAKPNPLQTVWGRRTNYLRTKPDWDSDVLIKVPNYYAATAHTDEVKNGFMKFTFQGKTGWHKLNVKDYWFAKNPTVKFKVTANKVNFRAKERWLSKIVQTKKKGDTFLYLKKAKNGWAVCVLTDGVIGHIPLDDKYIKKV